MAHVSDSYGQLTTLRGKEWFVPGPENTSATLLGRLRQEPADGSAWQEFVQRYRPRIYAHCLAWSVQPADAEDITQTVLLKLVSKMRTFHYDPSQRFRAWLKTVCRNVLSDYMNEQRRVQGSGTSEILRLLGNVEASEGLVQQLEAEFDQEVLQLALQQVRARVSDAHWEMFRLAALAGQGAPAVARQLGCPVAAIYRAKSKVQKQVREEIQRLEDRLG